MDNKPAAAQNIDEYIASFPPDVAAMMQKLRGVVHEVHPTMREKISWEMPTFYDGKIVIQFAGHKSHIGIYPGPDAIVRFSDRIAPYKSTKGGFQIPYGAEVPGELFRDLVLYNLEAVKSKESKK